MAGFLNYLHFQHFVFRLDKQNEGLHAYGNFQTQFCHNVYSVDGWIIISYLLPAFFHRDEQTGATSNANFQTHFIFQISPL